MNQQIKKTNGFSHVEAGVSFAKEWMKSNNIQITHSSGSLLIGKNGLKRIGIQVRKREHHQPTKPFESASYKESDYLNTIRKSFIENKIDEGYLLIVRTYRDFQKNNNYYSRTLSFFVLVPDYVLKQNLLIRNKRNKAKERTIDFGFSNEQIEFWKNKGVLFCSLFPGSLPNSKKIENSPSLSEKNVPQRKMRLDKDFKTYLERQQLNGTEFNLVVKTRLGQSLFREFLLRKSNQCRLCNISNPIFLIASHIKPWSVSSDEERLDSENGLLLCIIHDTLFDKGFISFDNNGSIIISKAIDHNITEKFNVNSNLIIKLSKKEALYMSYHRDNIFKR